MATATFVATDTTTQGTWLGVYGTLGYYKLVGSGSSVESGGDGALVSISGAGVFSFASATADVRGLQRADGSTRDGDVWFGASLDFLLAPSDSTTRRVRLYVVDWDSSGRDCTVTMQDHGTGTVLDTRTLAAGTFTGGAWLSWNVSGSLDLVVTHTAGPNAVASGIFWDTPAGAAVYVPRPFPSLPGGILAQ